MRKFFDILVEKEALDKLLNDEEFYIEEILITYHKKTDMAGALIRYKHNRFPEKRKWKRRIRRFFLSNGENPLLSRIISDKNFRLIEEYEFAAEEGGVVIVLDFDDCQNSLPEIEQVLSADDYFFEDESNTEEVEQIDNLALDGMLKELGKTQLQFKIDEALREGNREEFLRLTEQFKKLDEDV